MGSSHELPQRIRPRSDQHPEHLVRGIGSFRAPGPRMSFEERQAFLQRAAVQLEVGDQSKEQKRDRAAALREQLVRDFYEKALVYDLPIRDELRMEYEFMNLSQKKLAALEFQLSLTPTGVAARYIAWVHASLGTNAPNPLSGWLKELDAAIHEHYPGYDPYRLFRGAEREVFTLVGLYPTALLGWIEDASATLLLNIAATGCSNASSRSKPELAARLAEQRKHLRVWAAALKIIEDDYLKETVLPVALRSALDPGQHKFSTAISGNALERAAASKAKAATAEAQSRVETMFANAYASASVFYCNHALFSFAQAISAYGDCRRDYELAMSAMEPTPRPCRADGKRSRTSPQQPLPSKRSKPRGSARTATSTTQPEEAKTCRMKEMAL